MTPISISPIPAFNDNYIWALHDSTQAIVVDPGDAAPVKQFLEENHLSLAGILITHHHWDHTNGISALTQQWPGIPVWGPAQGRITGITQPVKQDDQITLPLGLTLNVLGLPGHTLDHLGYFCDSIESANPLVFSGDTLFSAGCGRMFEGTPEQMHGSLRLLASLPPATRIYCAHEYTASNLLFAAAVEPENPSIVEHSHKVEQLRRAGQPTVPTTLELELQINPFLRTHQASVMQSVSQKCGLIPVNATDTFAKLRSWKDQF